MIGLDIYQVRLENQVNVPFLQNYEQKLPILFLAKTNDSIFQKNFENLAFGQF